MVDRIVTRKAIAAQQRTRLAVLGSPISHSLSPTLHAAAYAVLGLDWAYEPIEVTGATLADFLAGCDSEWRGLSLTMPLKRDVMPFLDGVDQIASLTGVANTLLFEGGQRRGFNTDVAGITRAFAESGVDSLENVIILGGGATAASALVATSSLGAKSASFWVRDPSRASAMRSLGETLGMAVEIRALSDINGGVTNGADTNGAEGEPDAVISTLPNGSEVDLGFSHELRAAATLFDVAYEPWPSALALSWLEAGGRVIPGIQMLINQALVQVRIFVGGDPSRELPGENDVLAAMRASVGGA